MSGSGRRPGPGNPAADRGTVTAELAVGLVSVVTVLAAALGVAAAGAAQLACQDAARAGAREAARGEPQGRVVAVARHVAGRPVVVAVRPSGELVRVEVVARLRLPLPGGPSVQARAQAVAVTEPALP